ncbi:hypothetical protein [Microbacterium sp. KNMS]
MSLAQRVSELATRIGQEFAARFGPITSSTYTPAAGYPVFSRHIRKVGGLCVATIELAPVSVTGQIELGTFASGYRPAVQTWGVLIASGGPLAGTVRVAVDGSVTGFVSGTAQIARFTAVFITPGT